MRLPDELLIARAIVDHDVNAFDQLVRRHQSRVRGWLRYLAGDQARADDLAQDTFLSAWRKLSTYSGQGSFESWLLAIARNIFLQSQRKSGRESANLKRLAQQVSGETQALSDYHGEDTDADKFLEILGDDERDVMTLTYALGLSHREASTVSGLPLGTVKSHARRSIAKIRQRFELGGSNDKRIK